MISRRLLRIKALQVLYSYFKADNKSVQSSEKDLIHSIEKSHDLYHYLLLLIIELKDFAQKKIDLAKKKHIPTREDLHPNTKFIDNQLIYLVEQNESLQSFTKKRKISWDNDQDVIKKIYNEMVQTTIYSDYMKEEKSSFKSDVKYISELYSKFLINCETLYLHLEEISIYWNDDIDFVIIMLVKTIKSFELKKQSENTLMSLYRNDDDFDYVKELFRLTIIKYNDYEKVIARHIRNWDIERVAFMDIIVMVMAMVEIIDMPSIPIKVTLDEFIEIAKFYSTQKSNVFINGILDKIVSELKREGKIKKSGRGLIGEE